MIELDNLRVDAHGLSLAERARAYPSAVRADLPPHTAAEVARTADWWQQTYLLGNDALFTTRLRADGLTRRSVRVLLATDWLAATGAASVGLPAWPLAPASHIACDEVPCGLHHVFVHNAWRGVAEAVDAVVKAVPGLRVDLPAIRRDFANSLVMQLDRIAMPTYTIEMHIARLSGRLRGADPRERFENWVEEVLRDSGSLRNLLARYPGLLRALVTATVRTTDAWVEMLRRLGDNWDAVRAVAGGPPDQDLLVAVDAESGDRHRGGRSVMFLSFASGARVVYKPRPIATEAHFYALLQWFGDQGLDPALRPVALHDAGDHGWMEVVKSAPCRTPEEVRRFYRRMGSLLMVLHLLEAVDIHAENMIAVGEHPVLVDLEALFQAMPAGRGEGMAATRKAVFDSTVLKTGMLPVPRAGTIGTTDVSALSSTGGQRTAYPVAEWEDVGTDRMRVVHRQLDMDVLDNSPRLDGRPVHAIDYLDDIVDGFRRTYALVRSCRSQLAAEDGPLLAFRNDRARIVLRDTADYAVLLRGSYHPSCLRDAMHRDFVFDCLWLQTKIDPHLVPLIRSEREDLWEGDIPYFSAAVDKDHLIDSRERVIPGFLETSGLERVLSGLHGLDDQDLARQTACINGALATAARLPTPPPMGAEPRHEATPEELLDAATRVGERVAMLATRSGDEAYWTGQVPMRVKGSAMWGVLGPDLYDGNAGIALFLGHLAAATGRADFEALARRGAAVVVRDLRSAELSPSVGAFNGAAGMLYALSQLSALWDDPELTEEVDRALVSVARNARRDAGLDVYGGVAGCLLVMLGLAEQLPDCATRARDIANICGRRLLRRAQPADGALVWATAGAPDPLTGLSHGAAGIAWALAELGAATGDRRFERAARKALAYERRVFDPARGNWPDFRVAESPSESDPYLWGWCHGAPGIGLARLMVRERLGPDACSEIDEEVQAALASTDRFGFNDGHGLCHGDLGNAELFLVASKVYGDPDLRAAALRRAHAVLADEREHGAWRCNRRDYTELPGLMMGISGIGYGLLHLRDPANVPSVLTLETMARSRAGAPMPGSAPSRCLEPA